MGKIIWENEVESVFNSWVDDMLKIEKPCSLYKVRSLFVEKTKFYGEEILISGNIDGGITSNIFDDIVENISSTHNPWEVYYVDIDQLFNNIAKTIQYFISNNTNFTLLRESTGNIKLKLLCVKEEDSPLFPDKDFCKHYTFIDLIFERYDVINQGSIRSNNSLIHDNVYMLSNNILNDQYITGCSSFTIDDLAQRFEIDYRTKIISLRFYKLDITKPDGKEHKCRTWNDAIKTVI